MFRLDFDYLNDLPVLVLDVDDDFKSDRVKQEVIIDKVPFVLFLLLCFCSALAVSSGSVSPCRSKSSWPRCRTSPPITDASCTCYVLALIDKYIYIYTPEF